MTAPNPEEDSGMDSGTDAMADTDTPQPDDAPDITAPPDIPPPGEFRPPLDLEPMIRLNPVPCTPPDPRNTRSMNFVVTLNGGVGRHVPDFNQFWRFRLDLRTWDADHRIVTSGVCEGAVPCLDVARASNQLDQTEFLGLVIELPRFDRALDAPLQLWGDYRGELSPVTWLVPTGPGTPDEVLWIYEEIPIVAQISRERSDDGYVEQVTVEAMDEPLQLARVRIEWNGEFWLYQSHYFINGYGNLSAAVYDAGGRLLQEFATGGAFFDEIPEIAYPAIDDLFPWTLHEWENDRLVRTGWFVEREPLAGYTIEHDYSCYGP